MFVLEILSSIPIIKSSNGQFSFAKYIGTINFYPNFFITKILYILDFSVNLISVSKLCQNSK